MKRPILVTGASGNVGRHVVDQLLASGHAVRAATPATGSASTAGQTVESVPLDFTDPATWQRAFADVERVFLMRPPQLSKPKQQMIPALRYAQGAGVRHMTFLSLQGAEHNKVLPHAAIEQWLRESGVSWTFVRASFFMQNLTTTHVTDIRDRDEIVVPAGRGATAFVDAADVAAVATASLLDPVSLGNRAWTPTGPEALSYAQVADILTEVLGRPIRYPQPGALRYARHARRVLDLPWPMVAVTTAIYTAARLGKAGGLTGDVATVTGREPKSFRQFAVEHESMWR